MDRNYSNALMFVLVIMVASLTGLAIGTTLHSFAQNAPDLHFFYVFDQDASKWPINIALCAFLSSTFLYVSFGRYSEAPDRLLRTFYLAAAATALFLLQATFVGFKSSFQAPEDRLDPLAGFGYITVELIEAIAWIPWLLGVLASVGMIVEFLLMFRRPRPFEF